jgi:elongation factor Ts
MAVTAQEVKALREETGLPMMECKKALVEAEGDREKAKEILKKRGLKLADRKAGRETAEGAVGCYVHHNQKIGVMVEVNCETDFVARNEEFKAFVKDLCMHIAWARPDCVRREELDPELVRKEREIVAESLAKVPEAKREKAVEGKLAKTLYAQRVLLDQPFCKDEKLTVEKALKALVAKLRENVAIRRFCRFELGEESAPVSCADAEAEGHP